MVEGGQMKKRMDKELEDLSQNPLPGVTVVKEHD